MSIVLNKHSINASISDRYASICYEFEFENVCCSDNESDELKFVITIDSFAFISGFVANIDGIIFLGETKEKKEAKKEYFVAKEKNENAILISQPFKDIANVFEIKTNIDSKSKILLNIFIEQYLKKQLNFNELNIEIINKEFSKYNIKQKCKYIDINIDIYDKKGIFDLKLPLKSNIIIINKNKHKIHCKLSTTSYLNEFELKYKDGDDDDECFTLYNRESKTFLNIMNVSGLGFIPRRVVFIIDKSGSMKGNKWIKTISATITTLKQLRVNTDKYCLIFFNSKVMASHKQLILADTKNIYQSINYVSNEKCGGSTNINDALMKGIDLIHYDESVTNDDFFVNQIIFITDGEPNKGETDTNKIISNVNTKNKSNNKISIFSFGVGSDHNDEQWINDLNHSFLKLLALNNCAIYKRIKMYKCDKALNQYFNILSKPIAKNINVKYDIHGINHIDLTQNKFNTLYNGNDIIICGKIKHHKTVNIKMTVNISAITAINKKQIEINKKICIDLTNIQSTNNIQRIWAYLKLNQFAKKQFTNRDIIQFDDDDHQIPLSLAMRYNFVTPWTSMIVVKHKDESNDNDTDPQVKELNTVSTGFGNTTATNISQLDSAILKCAKGAAKTSHKQKALKLLKQKKQYEHQRDRMMGQQMNIDNAKFALESIKDNADMVVAMKSASIQLKQQFKEIDIDEVEDLQDEMMDLVEDAKEINDILGDAWGMDDFDEDELMDELDDLDDELDDLDLNEDEVPSYMVFKKENELNVLIDKRVDAIFAKAKTKTNVVLKMIDELLLIFDVDRLSLSLENFSVDNMVHLVEKILIHSIGFNENQRQIICKYFVEEKVNGNLFVRLVQKNEFVAKVTYRFGQNDNTNTQQIATQLLHKLQEIICLF